MYRLGVVTLYLLIFGAACGAAWLAGLSTKRWMPAAAFWATLIALGAVAGLAGVNIAGD